MVVAELANKTRLQTALALACGFGSPQFLRSNLFPIQFFVYDTSVSCADAATLVAGGLGRGTPSLLISGLSLFISLIRIWRVNRRDFGERKGSTEKVGLEHVMFE